MYIFKILIFYPDWQYKYFQHTKTALLFSCVYGVISISNTNHSSGSTVEYQIMDSRIQ